jgi:hypothetical protein
MLTRQKFIEKINNVDWGFFDNDYPSIAFLLRCCEDYYYVEQLAQGKINSQNDARVKAAAELIKKGIEFIPIVGDIFTMIAEIGGIDLGAFGSISDSVIAANRLGEWINYIANNYTQLNNNLPPLNQMNQRFINATSKLIKARPKCLSPTPNCSREHQQYIARTSLLKESQYAIYDIYYNYCQSDYNFNRWLIEFTKQNNNSSSGIGGMKMSNASLPLLLGLGFLLLKK